MYYRFQPFSSVLLTLCSLLLCYVWACVPFLFSGKNVALRYVVDESRIYLFRCRCSVSNAHFWKCSAASKCYRFWLFLSFSVRRQNGFGQIRVRPKIDEIFQCASTYRMMLTSRQFFYVNECVLPVRCQNSQRQCWKFADRTSSPECLAQVPIRIWFSFDIGGCALCTLHYILRT